MKRQMGSMAALLLALVAAPVAARTWQVDAAHSTLGFTNSYQTVTYTGHFHRFSATIDYDPADLAHARFDVSIDITSLDTQNSERDHEALAADFLDAAKFPRAHFVTTSFQRTPGGAVRAEGKLMLRGVTKPVALVVRFVPHGDTATLDVTAQVRRLAFGIGGGQWADPSLIGDEVVVHGHLLLRAMP